MQPSAHSPGDDATPFVLRMPTAFWWTVRIPIPTDDTYQVATLRVQFKPVDQHRLDAMQGLNLPPGELPPTEHAICHEVVVGWWKLPDEHGVEQPFSAEALDRLLAVPVVRAALVATYLAAMRGMAARKNA